MSPEAWIAALAANWVITSVWWILRGVKMRRAIAERDAALRDKAAQFERWQSEVGPLRRIADAAEALASGPNSPGEWAALREAIRARKESHRE